MNQPCFQIGDHVIVTNTKRSPGRRPRRRQASSERPAQIIGFTEEYVGRLHNWGRKPGVYRDRNVFMLRLGDGREIMKSYSSILPMSGSASPTSVKMRCRQDIRYPEDFLRELPDLPIWEGDYVRVRPGNQFFDPTKDYRVNKIRYDFTSYPDPIPGISVTYQLSEKLGRFSDNVYPSLSEEELYLLGRGEVWKIYRHVQIKFSGLAEEASFYLMLGRAEKVCHPSSTEPIAFITEEEAKDAVRAGIAHAYIKNSLFFLSPTYHAIRFRDPELGRRVAEATLAGLGPIEY